MIGGTGMAADDLAPAVGAAGATRDDAVLARELAACGRCLGAYLVAVETRRATACPACASIWRVDTPAREHVVDVPADLDALARWLPTIGGRAWAPSEMGRGAPRNGERPDHVDEHHRDPRSGLRRGLRALSVLDAMERAGQRRHVRVLWFAYVLTGPELVKVYERTGQCLEMQVGYRFVSAEQRAFWAAHKSAVVARHQLREAGERILAGARGAYVAALRALDAPAAPATTPRSPAPQLAGDLDALIAKTVARHLEPKSETNPAKSATNPAKSAMADATGPESET